MSPCFCLVILDNIWLEGCNLDRGTLIWQVHLYVCVGSPCSQGASECQHAAETATSEGRTYCCHSANARITLTNINGEVTCTCTQI